MDIESLAKYVDIADVPDDWIKYYDSALKAFNTDWLNIDLQKLFDFYDFEETFRERVTLEIKNLKQDINLNFLVYLWYFIMFKTEDDYKIWRWKNDFSYFKSHGSFMMPVIAFLMYYPEHEKVMNKLEFDEMQILAHKKEIKLTCINDNLRLGIDGVRFSQMVWASRFMKGHIIKVGVLQYELKKGILDGEDAIFIHIPRNTDLAQNKVLKSLTDAQKLVKKYLKADNLPYVTESWLLSPELKSILDNNSNIIKFQKNFKVLKEEENVKDFLNFVFNKPFFKGEYNDLPESTKLQKGLKKKLINGEKLYICLGILK